MTNKQDLIQALTKFVKWVFREEKFYNSIGKVISVDETEKTCKVEIINGETIEDVRLQQVASDLGLLIKPKINSLVVVGWSDKVTASIVMFSEIDNIAFQNGENGGLIVIADLVTKLNKLVGEVNDLKGKYNSHRNVIPAGTVITAVAGGTLNAVPITLAIRVNDAGSDATQFDKNDFENTKFTH